MTTKSLLRACTPAEEEEQGGGVGGEFVSAAYYRYRRSFSSCPSTRALRSFSGFHPIRRTLKLYPAPFRAEPPLQRRAELDAEDLRPALLFRC